MAESRCSLDTLYALLMKYLAPVLAPWPLILASAPLAYALLTYVYLAKTGPLRNHLGLFSPRPFGLHPISLRFFQPELLQPAQIIKDEEESNLGDVSPGSGAVSPETHQRGP